jgi:hypothetical protein
MAWPACCGLDRSHLVWPIRTVPPQARPGYLHIQGWTGGGRGSQFYFDHAPPSTPAINTRPDCDYCSHQYQLVLYTSCTHPAHSSFFGSQNGRDNPLTLSAYVCAPFNQGVRLGKVGCRTFLLTRASPMRWISFPKIARRVLFF